MKNNTLKGVKRSPVVHKNGCKRAFNKLPSDEKNAVIGELMNFIKGSVSSVYGKIRGDSPIREAEIPVFESIFLAFNIDPWTGNKL